MFKHFILTRFNLKLEGISSLDKNKKPVQTDKWLEHRFFLFEKYCLPSIMSQTCQNFVWFVLFSSDTPDKYKHRNTEIESQYPLFKPLYLDSGDYDSIKKTFHNEMVKYLEEDVQYIFTTRIDNDDAFHDGIIEDLQNRFTEEKDRFLSYPYGLQYDINNNILGRTYFRNNHFISRIENINKGIETVLTYNHAFIDEVAPVVYFQNRRNPMWLEIIHEGNVKNLFDETTLPLISGKQAKHFQLNISLSRKNTILALLGFVKFRFFLARAFVLRKLGIYNMLKKSFRKNNSVS